MYANIAQRFVSARIQRCHCVTPRAGNPISHPYTVLQCAIPSIHLYTLLLQFRSRLINLLHKLRVCIGHVVEGEDAVAEFEKEEGTEGDEGPEG